MTSKDANSRFIEEVIENGIDSTLPCNLSDEWLGILLGQAENFINGQKQDDIPELFSAIFHILAAKNDLKENSIVHTRLFDYFEQYRTEMALEMISRQTDIRVEPADIDTIFTERSVKCSLSEK
tara:strand:- start:1009 stop:1380 length:372 start_codon:yes stop_codon:yes gene_type:complete